MDSWRLKPARLTMEKIREATEEFRKDHIFADTLPVEIERVIEATMGITIIPIKSLHKDCDMDELFSVVAPKICTRFDVSADVIERRLRKENIMDLIG